MYTVADARTYGPILDEGLGQGWIGAIATGVAAIAQVGATIYTTKLQGKAITEQYRQQRQLAAAEAARQNAIAQNIATAAGTAPGTMQEGGASYTEKPAGTVVLGGMPIDSSKIMLYGGIGIAALVLIFALRR